jgi:hypothetical protein
MHFLAIVAAVALGVALARGADALLRAFGLVLWLAALAAAA